MADYDGNNIFGFSARIQMIQQPSEQQLTTFFGLSGVLSLWGGGRGRVFLCEGLLVGSDAADLHAQRVTFLSYDDGIARTLTDTLGVTWPQVVFRTMEPTSRIYQFPGGGLCFEYRALFEGRI